jgi:chitodextrinase
MLGRLMLGKISSRVLARRSHGRRNSPRPWRLGLLAAIAAAAVTVGGASARSAVTLGLGSTSVYSRVDSNSPGSAEAFRAVAGGSGQASALTVYVDSGSSATALVAGLYADASGHPGTLLAQGRLSGSPVRGAWNTVPLSSTASIRSGSTYWIAILSPSGALKFRDARSGSSSNPSETSAQTGLTSLPSGWRTGKSYRDGPLSAYAVGTVADTAAPSVPTGLHTESLGSTSLTLLWTASTDNVGVTGYDVYLGSTNIGHTAGGTSFGVTGLTCGTSYSFSVAAYDAAGNSSAKSSPLVVSTPACPDTTAPSTPGSLAIGNVTATGFSLSWSASTDNVGVDGYRAYLNGATAGTTTSTTYAFSSLTCGTSYTVAVEAFDAAGNVSSRPSVSVATAACPDTTPPSAPGGLAAANVGATSLTLSWDASSDDVGVVGYNVYQGSTRIASPAGTSVSVSGLSAGTSYSFSVEALDAAGNVSPRASVNVTTAAASPPPSGGATVFISPSGSDSNACTQAAPCRSFDRAYHVAQPGQTVQMAGGDYGGQSLTYDGSKVNASSNVVFVPAPGATVTASGELSVRASASQPVAHVEIDNVRFGDVYLRYANNVVLRNDAMAFFFLRDTVNVQILGGEVYGNSDAISPTIGTSVTGGAGAKNTLIDGVSFHDVNRANNPTAHTECLFIQESSGTVVRNSSFTRCEIFDVYLNPIMGGSVTGAVLDHNTFDATSPTGYYAVRSNVAQYSVTNNVFGQGISWDTPGTTIDGCGNTAAGSGFTLADFLAAACT